MQFDWANSPNSHSGKFGFLSDFVLCIVMSIYTTSQRVVSSSVSLLVFISLNNGGQGDYNYTSAFYIIVISSICCQLGYLHIFGMYIQCILNHFKLDNQQIQIISISVVILIPFGLLCTIIAMQNLI